MKFQYILLASVLLAVAFAAPKEEAEETSAVAETKKADKKSSTDERSVDVINEDWGTYLANNYGGIAFSGVAILLIVAGLGYAFYHYYYIQYAAGLGAADQGQYGQPHAYPYGQYPAQYSAYSGRYFIIFNFVVKVFFCKKSSPPVHCKTV